MLGLLVADRQQAGPAAGGGFQGPGEAGGPDQGANAGGVVALHPHRVEPQAGGQGQGPALEFPQQHQPLALAPGHPNPQAPEQAQGAPHLQPQQQALALGMGFQLGQARQFLGWWGGGSGGHGGSGLGF
jgi:hypothetical protein